MITHVHSGLGAMKNFHYWCLEFIFGNDIIDDSMTLCIRLIRFLVILLQILFGKLLFMWLDLLDVMTVALATEYRIPCVRVIWPDVKHTGKGFYGHAQRKPQPLVSPELPYNLEREKRKEKRECI